jgi:23S rRNA pseudouridine1911/1915/1917 synthase
MAEVLTVPPEAAGERLDVFLAAHAGSRAAAQRLIDGGGVTVDGQPRPKRHVLAGGETVAVAEVGSEPEPAAVPPAPFAVAYEDEHLLVIDKPPGVVVHPARGHRQGTLVQALAGRVAGGDDPERPGIVHRLDRDTSGLLVVARSDAAHAALKALLARRELVRE